MTDLAELIERVERASGEDQQLDLDIWAALGNGGVSRPYTTSIDSALSLVERMLPGWTRDMTEYPPGLFIEDDRPVDHPVWAVSLTRPGLHVDLSQDSDHRSLPLAILLALLKALHARREEC